MTKASIEPLVHAMLGDAGQLPQLVRTNSMMHWMHEVRLPTLRSQGRARRRIIPSAIAPFFFSDSRIAKEVYSTMIHYPFAKYATSVPQ
jgi:hypothetical protein